jgi:hypothetical protein
MKKLFLLLMLLPAIAFAGPLKQEPKGKLIVYREGRTIGALMGMHLQINRQPWVRLKNGSYAEKLLPPGTYRVRVKVFSMPPYHYDIILRSGQTIYMEARGHYGAGASVEEVDAAKALKEIPRLRIANQPAEM